MSLIRQKPWPRGGPTTTPNPPQQPELQTQPPRARVRSVAVIGGGLAGVCVARALARAAIHAEVVDLVVTLFESSAGIAMGASAVPAAVLHPLDSRDHNLASQFFALGVETTMEWARALGGETSGWADLSGVDQHLLPGMHTPIRQRGGWIRPAAFIDACLEDVRACLGTRFHLALGQEMGAAQWQDLLREFDAVVVCSAEDALIAEAGLALQPLAGQLSSTAVVPEHLSAVRQRFPRVTCGQGFVTPVIDGQMFFGATFHRGCRQASVTYEDHHTNLHQLDGLWPEADRPFVLAPERLEGWAGVRFATRDRLPHIGQPVAASVYRGGLPSWRLPRSVSQLHQLPRDPGVYVLLGLGARGLSTAPLGANALAADMLGLAPVLSSRLRNAVDPGRFVLREHARAEGGGRLIGP